MYKPFETLLMIYYYKKKLISMHQFGFKKKHSTNNDKIHCITDIIEKACEENHIYSAIFLDVAQVWYVLINKLETMVAK